MPRLTACVITYNEEDNIARCLRSLSFADEIIVVDSGSTDRTVAITRQFTSRIIHHDWPGFGPQKDLAFSQANGDWILSIDADEEVPPELQTEILAALVDPGECAGFRFPRKNLIGSYWAKYGSCFHNYPDYVMRLFKKSCGYCGTALVHEGLHVEGRVKELKSPLIHYSYSDWHEYRASMDYFSRLKALDLLKKRQPNLPLGLLMYLPYVIITFLNYYLYKAGLLMGWIGLRAAYEQARYVARKYGLALFWHLAGCSVEELTPQVLAKNRT